MGRALRVLFALVLLSMAFWLGRQSRESDVCTTCLCLRSPGSEPGARRVNSLGMGLRWIPPGDFLMGSPEDEPGRSEDECLPTRVALDEGFWISECEVTQAAYQSLTGEKPSANQGGDLPVDMVSWFDAVAFAKRLTAREQAEGHLSRELVYRLPSEVEWEYAARAGTRTIFPLGDRLTTEQANYNGSRPFPGGEAGVFRKQTVPVTRFAPNAWGLYQTSGNVIEWCLDHYTSEAPVPVGAAPRILPDAEEQAYRVGRNGGWNSIGKALRCASRLGYRAGLAHSGLGFRLVVGRPIQTSTP